MRPPGGNVGGPHCLSVGSHLCSDSEMFVGVTVSEQQTALESLVELHRHKIGLADEILVINVGRDVGESTRAEIEYARARGKRVRWLEPEEGRGKP